MTPAEREMIATYVSSENDCYYCQHCHGSTAAQHLGGDEKEYEFMAQMKRDFESTALSPKMKALLNIAGNVQKGGKQVTTADVERARQEGATDKEIHDTVLIAAAFCMFNRYVDGLATWQPHDPNAYREIGQHTARLCRRKMRMSGLRQVEMSAFMDGRGPYGNGANHVEPKRTGPIESVARGKAEASFAGRSSGAAEGQ